jgi:segregation and condensation protein A
LDEVREDGAARETRTRPVFKLKDFEGSLDLLLFLLKKNDINLYDIPISEITAQYFSYLEFSDDLDLDDLTDFYATAALLLYIKSRMLLPIEFSAEDEIEDPREELVEKLIEYQKFKKLSELMEEKEREAEWVIERKKLQRVLPFEDEQLWEKMDVWDLLKTFSSLTRNASLERIMDMHEEVSINEKIALIEELLERKGECTFIELVVRKNSLMDVVCAFLAVLEAVKLRLIMIYQNRMFGDILIRSAAAAADTGERADGDEGGAHGG